MNCNYCGKILPKRSTHQTYCEMNPNKKIRKNGMLGKKGGNQFTKAFKLGKEKPEVTILTRSKLSVSAKNRKLSDDHKEKLRISAKKNSLGGITQSRWIEYKGKKLGSSYELELVKDLEIWGIKWDTCKRFNYIDPSGKVRSYTPDIYLLDYDVYLDPKNDFLIDNINPSLGFTDIEKIERVQKQNDITVIILRKDELNWESVKNKINDYGK